MATRLKTVEYWFPELAAVTDASDTNFTQITIYLPESSKVFKSVYLDTLIQDAEISSNACNRRQLSLQIGSSGYTVVNNTNTVAASGEHKWIPMSADFTTLFVNSWSGTSMTCDARILFDNAITTPSQNWRCATAKLVITYEYDDSSTTHVKTVRLPLGAPIANMATSKPGTATATIPSLASWLPEDSVVIRQYAIVVQGNEESANTTDKSISWVIDSETTYTTGVHEAALSSSCWYRHCQLQSFSTSASHSFYIWASAAAFAHAQVWLSVTYEFNDSASSTILNSVLLPMEFDSPAGGTTSADYQRASREFCIQEPGTITIKESALIMFWDQPAGISGIQYRVNAGSWSGALTSTAGTVAGSCGSMFRCEPYVTLTRGLNTLYADVYRTDTADLMCNISSFWMLNYTSGKSTLGSGVHNKSVCFNIQNHSTVAAAVESLISAVAITVPDTYWFRNSIGTEFGYTNNGSNAIYGFAVHVERLAAESGVKWESLYQDFTQADSLLGLRTTWSQGKDIFRRWSSDPDATRLSISTARRYRAYGAPSSGWRTLNMWITYHSIVFTISGTVSGSSGGTVNLSLVRGSDKVIIKTTSRVGNGSYSFTIHDNTNDYYVDAYEDSTHVGRSSIGTAEGTP